MVERLMIHILISALIVLAILSVVGISRPRRLESTTWCWIYVMIAISFDAATIVAVALKNQWLMEILLGIAAGSATSLAYHVWKEIKELSEQK
ncbi:MAG: hypothetical protein QXZ68_00230 [Candidatus Bathyarchaeia archaeon]